MNTFKKILLSMVVVSISSFAVAGDGMGKDHKRKAFDADKRVEFMTKKLDLSADQQPQVKAILETANTKRKALHEQAKSLKDSGTSREEIKAQLKSQHDALRTEEQTQLKAVLTPEQSQKVEEMKAKRGDKKGKRKAKKEKKDTE